MFSVDTPSEVWMPHGKLQQLRHCPLAKTICTSCPLPLPFHCPGTVVSGPHPGCGNIRFHLHLQLHPGRVSFHLHMQLQNRVSNVCSTGCQMFAGLMLHNRQPDVISRPPKHTKPEVVFLNRCPELPTHALSAAAQVREAVLENSSIRMDSS